MEMSKAATKKRIAKKNARVGGKKYVTPLPKAKSTAGGRNRTALRTPQGARSVTKKKKVAAPNSDAGKYMGPYSKRTTSAKKKTTAKPTAGRRTDAKRAADKKKLLAEQKRLRAAGNKKSLTRFVPQMSVKKAEKVGSGLRLGGEVGLAAAALAGTGGAATPAVAGTSGGRAVLSGLSRLKNLFKPKTKPKPRTKKPTAADKKKSKNTELGYAQQEINRRAASRAAARNKRNKKT